jgi:AraC-like DNA-binding protein
MITCKQYIPSPLLQRHIKFYYLFEQAESSEKAYHLVTPDGCIELNFNLQSQYMRKEQNGKTKKQHDFYLISRFSERYYLQTTGNIKMIGIRFYPWGIRPFIEYAANEITDKQLDPEAVFGSKINSLREQVLNMSRPDMAIEVIERFFIMQLYRYGKEDLMIADAAFRILNSGGKIEISSLLAPCNLSLRRLQQRFNESVGVSPKFFSKLAKFQYALRQLNEHKKKSSLTEIAYESGYFDQSHFIRDFRFFSGITPKNYLSGEFELNKIISRTALLK